MNKISILNADINHFRKGLAQGAKLYKDIAETMVFEQGLRGNVTDKFVRKIMPDTFDESGELTKTGKENVKSIINLLFNGKKKDCNVREFFNKLFAATTISTKQQIN